MSTIIETTETKQEPLALPPAAARVLLGLVLEIKRRRDAEQPEAA